MNIGLFLREFDPTILISAGYKAAIGENMRIARPDSPQFSLGSFKLQNHLSLIRLPEVQLWHPVRLLYSLLPMNHHNTRDYGLLL